MYSNFSCNNNDINNDIKNVFNNIYTNNAAVAAIGLKKIRMKLTYVSIATYIMPAKPKLIIY
jgi:hypothetical protein